MPLPPRLFCDTSFFYACLDPGDVNHKRAKVIVDEAITANAVLWVTWDIISEAVTLLRYRRNFQAALTFLTEVKPSLAIVTYGDRVREEAEQFFRQYGRDLRLSFCDAISFVVLTTLLDDVPCLTFDRDFRRLGLTVIT
ncbi:MAG: type II toxin-antitoxin system VapC family toxin [Candidatus Methylomirabilis sp.]